jgi:O-antigen biosynthesis protein
VKHHLPPESSVLLARMSDRWRPRVLVIDDLVPFPAHGAGFPRASRVLKSLHSAGCFITYYPMNQPEVTREEVYAEFPIEIEFMVGHRQGTLLDFLDERAGYYHAILVCRPHNMELFLRHFEEHPEQYGGISIIYDAEALFTAREAMRLALVGTPLPTAEEESRLRKEADLARAADAVITVSPIEADVFKTAGHSNIHVVGHAIEPAPLEAVFAERQDFLFVGPMYDDYGPNADAVSWFIREVMPHLDRLLASSYRFYVAGTLDAPRIRSLASPRVVLLGRVKDLTPYYNWARVLIAPTRFAAGIPLKIYESAARGLPVVATNLLARQLGWQCDAELLTADTPEDFAAQCARLYTDPALWGQLRQAALVRVTKDCDPAALDRKLVNVLRSVGVVPP